MSADRLVVRGAREHNLKNVSLDLPRNAMIVFTGLSGSGKSSLAFDTIFAEGQRRYVESLSAYARQFLGQSAPSLISIQTYSSRILRYNYPNGCQSCAVYVESVFIKLSVSITLSNSKSTMVFGQERHLTKERNCIEHSQRRPQETKDTGKSNTGYQSVSPRKKSLTSSASKSPASSEPWNEPQGKDFNESESFDSRDPLSVDIVGIGHRTHCGILAASRKATNQSRRSKVTNDPLR